VHLRVAADQRFEREGDDLHHEAHISFAQAALGTSIEVPTLRASTTIDVDAGSASGTVHRVRHEGVEHLHGRGRGDMFVHLIVDVPSELDDVEPRLVASARPAPRKRRLPNTTVRDSFASEPSDDL